MIGPLWVTGLVGRNVVRLKLPSGSRAHNVVNVNRYWLTVKVGSRILKKRLSFIAPVPEEDRESHAIDALSVPMPRPPGFLPLRPAEESAGPAMVGGSGQEDRRPARSSLVGEPCSLTSVVFL